MSILYLLIPLSLILLSLATWAFFWAVKHNQFEDLEGPAYRILFDDDANDTPLAQRRHDETASDSKAEEKPPEGSHRGPSAASSRDAKR